MGNPPENAVFDENDYTCLQGYMSNAPPRAVRLKRHGILRPSQQPGEEDHQDEQRQHELEEQLEPGGELEAPAFVGLGKVAVKTPAPFGGAEEQVDKRAQRQQQVAHQEVLGVQHVAAADEMHAGEHVVAQQGRHGRQQDEDAVDDDGLFPVPAEHVNAVGNQVFKHGDDRGEAGECHEQEEQRAPEAAAPHAGKDVGQGDEDQRRAGVRLHAEGEAGREDDQAAHQRHEGIQQADAHGLARQRVLAGHI